MNSNFNDEHSASKASFDVRDHLDKLEPGKGKGYYTCPVCEGRRLGVDPDTGAYQCWSGSCSTDDIREAIRPLAEFLAERKGEQPAPQAKKPRAKKKKLLPVPIPIGAKLLRLLAPGQSPQPEQLTDAPKRVPRNALQTTYAYSPTQSVVRYEWPDATNPKGHDKTYSQFHLDLDGKKVWNKGDAPWPAYRIDEVVELLETLPDGEPIVVLMPEGEPNVEIARGIRVAALTLQGSNWSDREIQKMLETLRATGKNVILGVLRDNDDTGIKKSNGVWLVARHIQFPCLVINPREMWADIPEKGDIREFLEAMEADEFLIRVEAEITKAANSSESNNPITPHPRTYEDVVCLSSSSNTEDYIPDTAPSAGQNFILKAEDALYSDGHYVSIGEVLYRFTGSYYEELHEKKEKRRIGGWLKTYSEKVKGAWVTNRADTASVNAVFSWVVNQTAVEPAEVNAGGLNCSNGVVKVYPDGTHELVAHDPKNVYTYVGCKYDPDIDRAHNNRLLECLEPSQREIFLRTGAAPLDMKLVRSKLTGRGVKGLICDGKGSNGKDTLRAVVAAIYGRGMTGKSLSDFKAYDMGRKFTLAGIEGSLCNWASENTAKVDLDGIQSLKQFITGDPLDIERKGKDSYEYKPIAAFFANCNKLPSITGGTSAIDDRYGILSFDKTYVRNADPSKGELEADPRFKDDEKFILEQVAPAMLNEFLERFPLLLAEGIDYKATQDAMQKAQEESRHLWHFARDAGIEVQAVGRIYIKDLWELLQKWYVETGTLEIEEGNNGKNKLIWHELPNKYDTPVKAVNQVFARFSEIFPKIQKLRHTEGGSVDPLKGQFYLSGIVQTSSALSLNIASLASLAQCDGDTASLTASLAKKSEAASEARTLASKESEASEAISSPFVEVCKLVAQLTDAEWQKLMELRTPSQSLARKITPQDAQKMRDIAQLWWDEYYPEQMQSLIVQMYSWQAPGNKYDVAIIAEWLEGEDSLIRDRITELIHLRKA
jgi:putative DNA primase/helicase